MKTLLWLTLSMALAGRVFAEERPNVKMVKVTGVSEVKVVPDRAVIEIGVEKQSPSASSAKTVGRCSGTTDPGGHSRQRD